MKEMPAEASKELAQLPQFQGLKNFFNGWGLDRGHIST
jgi:hypothetical protein